MFKIRAYPIGTADFGRGAAHVAPRTASMAADRPTHSYVGVWRQNPASGRLELRWQPAPESPLRYQVRDAIRAAA